MTDFTRNIHCVMGLPIDSMSMKDVLQHLQRARITRQKCFFSTPNLNFLFASYKKPNFRESVCMSDLSLADGMPLVWISKLLAIPIRERVSGSDLFEGLRRQTESLWRIFFFGGPQGAAQAASLSIGSNTEGMLPTGFIYPGFGSIEEMGRDDLISCINESKPDMVVVSLGAAKGQDWICRNHKLIDAPVIVHLGAVVNFVAGTVQRAPLWMQRSGLEWVWRAKEESVLIKRYFYDGLAFLGLLATRVAPLMLHQACNKPQEKDLANASLRWVDGKKHSHIELSGAWTANNLQPIRNAFATAENMSASLVLDMAKLHSIDSAFLGLLLLLDQSMSDRHLTLRLINMPKPIRKYLKLSIVLHLNLA
jgi:N-acetylglucosaminyldiphosphoundecaprenol N-acetyl-beta-D-mannosaminyltransferase